MYRCASVKEEVGNGSTLLILLRGGRHREHGHFPAGGGAEAARFFGTGQERWQWNWLLLGRSLRSFESRGCWKQVYKHWAVDGCRCVAMSNFCSKAGNPGSGLKLCLGDICAMVVQLAEEATAEDAVYDQACGV